MSAPEGVLERPAVPLAGSVQGAALVAVVVAWIATVALLWGTFTDMWRVWGASGTFTHGYLIFPIVLMLLWMRRDQWRLTEPRPAIGGFVLIAVAAVIWLVGSLLNLNIVMQFGAVGLLVAEVIAIAGFGTFRRFAFPLMFMLLAVPAGEELVPSLMDFTAVFTVKALDLVGIPVFSEGRLIYIPTGNFAVEKACSGVRYLIASTVLGILYAHLHYRTLWRRLLFVALAAVVPVIANGVRAFLIVLLAHLSDNRIAVGIDHLIYGWFFFGVVMLLVVWIGQSFAEPRHPADQPVVAGTPSNDGPPARSSSRTTLWLTAVLALAPIAVGVAAARKLEETVRADAATMTQGARVPVPQPGWTGPLTMASDWHPRFLGPTSEVRAAYLRGTTNIDVGAVLYLSERPGAELVNSENLLFDPDRWRWLSERTIEVVLADGSRLPLHEVIVRSGVTLRTIWLARSVDGKPVFSSLDAKWQRARDLLAGGSGAGVAVVISSRGSVDRPLPEADLREFVVKYYAPVLQCLVDNSGPGGSTSSGCVAAP